MRLLLDTHALLWVVLAPERLGEKSRSEMIAEGAEVYASHVSLWEMAIKRRLGKLDALDQPAISWFETYVVRSGLRPLPIEVSHLGAVEFLPPLHNDPFDRLLVAQARINGLTVVTRDDLVAQYDISVIW